MFEVCRVIVCCCITLASSAALSLALMQIDGTSPYWGLVIVFPMMFSLLIVTDPVEWEKRLN